MLGAPTQQGQSSTGALDHHEHVKNRSVYDEDERRDLTNIGMLARKIGCDDFYKLGYIAVNSGGLISVASDANFESAVTEFLGHLNGRKCRAFLLGLTRSILTGIAE